MVQIVEPRQAHPAGRLHRWPLLEVDDLSVGAHVEAAMVEAEAGELHLLSGRSKLGGSSVVAPVQNLAGFAVDDAEHGRHAAEVLAARYRSRHQQLHQARLSSMPSSRHDGQRSRSISGTSERKSFTSSRIAFRAAFATS